MAYSRGGAAPSNPTTLTLTSDEHITRVTARQSDYADWVKVRHVPASYGAWHPATDNLNGSEAYGDKTDDSQPWSIRFDSIDFDEFRFATVNQSHWVDYGKSHVVGSTYGCGTSRNILRSSTNANGYSTTSTCNRSNSSGRDPLIAAKQESGCSSGSPCFLYHENNNSGSGYWDHVSANGGADVYVRKNSGNSCHAQGACNNGYMDTTNGHLYDESCGSGCSGGSRKTDGACNCACTHRGNAGCPSISYTEENGPCR